jgi:hypothetical protein
MRSKLSLDTCCRNQPLRAMAFLSRDYSWQRESLLNWRGAKAGQSPEIPYRHLFINQSRFFAFQDGFFLTKLLSIAAGLFLPICHFFPMDGGILLKLCLPATASHALAMHTLTYEKAIIQQSRL